MAYEKHLDGFGVIVLASVTAIGGGTLRDMMLDQPVFWVADPSFFYVILTTAALTIVWVRRNTYFPHQYLLNADAIGLAFFNVMGGAVYITLQALTLENTICMLVAMATTLAVRLMAMRWHWHLRVFPVNTDLES